MSNYRIICLPLFILNSLSPFLFAQSIDTPIYEQNGSAIKENQQEIIDKALIVREKVSALPKAEIDKQLTEPVPETIKLPPALTKEMSSEEIAEHARKSNLRVGYCYKCMKCDHWHISLAGGYAIAPDVIVTCEHVLATKTKMRDGFIVVCDSEGNVACVTAVLARSSVMDAAIIKVAGADFKPIPLNSNIKQGSPSYCFSYPLRQEGYFSAGVVNRFYWRNTYRGEDKETIDALCHLRINYSNDWAPGSSGSPLFDSAGNVTGHVSTINGLSSGKGKPTYLVLHEGVPAGAVKILAEHLKKPEEIKRLANAETEETKTPAETKPPTEN